MLEFKIINQTIKRIDKFNPATDSVDYLEAKFDCATPDWEGRTKTAIFRLGTMKYSAVLDSTNSCLVPHEVLEASDKSRLQLAGINKIYVSLFGVKGVSRITTDEVRVELSTSGYGETETSKEPTPDVFTQYVAQVEGYIEDINATLDAIIAIQNALIGGDA